MFDAAAPHVFTLPPGIDFATELVRGLQDRLADGPPERLARLRLFVNSQRMRRREVQVFSARGAQFLPQIRVVTELDADLPLADFAARITPLRRRLDLARLIARLLDAQPDLAPRSALFDLADSLANLLGEMQGEGVSVDRVGQLDVSTHSAHWARAQEFLKIVAPLMADPGDAPARQRAAAERMAADWKANPPVDPVIIAGSTGSRGATAILMQAAARLDNGAVVLPGFDGDLPDTVWRAMDDALTAEDHPQYRFRKLMDVLAISPADLRPWCGVVPADVDRNRLISLSLRPAPVTDQWLVEGAKLPDLMPTTREMTLIEAASPREEALAIALILRQAVATGTRAAFITPDRGLTRRVAAALDLWRIAPDDSAGHPLALSAPGRLLRHIAFGFGRTMTADGLLTLLKHPLAGSGAARGAHLRFTRELELELRRKGPAFPTGAAVLDWAAKRKDVGVVDWAECLAKVLDGFVAPVLDSLESHISRHISVAEALARGTDAAGSGKLWLNIEGMAALDLMQQLQAEAARGDAMTPAGYCDLFEMQIQQGVVREAFTGHPLVAFYGHREVREMQADLVILGGLTDGIWPAATDPDPWLNRKMRKDAGLLLPERQIGLAAHDYQQAVAAKTVFLSRSVRDAEAEMVPSRWLNRMCNLMAGLPERNGPEVLTAMRARGQVWLQRAAVLERATPAQLADPRLRPAPRPAPRPPVVDRPKKLSLTRIATLIRDPYAIYARYILNLLPMDPLRPKPDQRDRGNALHAILELFVRQRPPVEDRATARLRLMAIAARVLAEHTPFPSARLLWLARLERAADHFLRQDSKHGGTALMIEENGSIRLSEADFTLFGTPDRIDELADGRLHLIDYKSGSPPTKMQQKLFDKQLLLAAAMAEKGGFASLGPREVVRISYIGLGPGEKLEETDIIAAELDELWARFVTLIQRYAQPGTCYTARRAIFESRHPLDYDHLSRFGEWQMSDHATGFDVGSQE